MSARILFLREFTKELVLNSVPELKFKIDALEKQRREEIEKQAKIQRIREELKRPEKTELRPEPKEMEEIEEEKIEDMMQSQFSPRIVKPRVKEIRREVEVEIRPKEEQKVSPLRGKIKQGLTPLSEIKLEKSKEIREEGRPEFDLGKLNPFISDRLITSIECPGPGKFILIKRANKLEVTKIRLDKSEIESIIKKFSEKSRIPLIGGIFKTVVGNLVITALQSDIVGSRFIITKISPYQPQFF